MKSTEIFKRTIRTYLEQRAASDERFALSYAKPHKRLDDCITYIFNTVRKSGCNGFTDDEIYSMAINYYCNEDNIEAGKPIHCSVTVNHTVELTEEEKEQARKEAIQKVQDEAFTRMKQPLRKSQVKQSTVNEQLTFF